LYKVADSSSPSPLRPASVCASLNTDCFYCVPAHPFLVRLIYPKMSSPWPPVQYATLSTGPKIAYRIFHPTHPTTSVPLILQIHFRGNMDLWDPVLVRTLSAHRSVLIFDQSGIGRSSGSVGETFQAWADVIVQLCQALDFSKIDLLGFSMGGCAVQMVALSAPGLVRRLICAGTTPSAPTQGISDLSGIVWPREEPPHAPFRALASATGPEEVKKAIAYSFFYDDDQGRRAFAEYWQSVLELQGREKGKSQGKAFMQFQASGKKGGSYDRLHELRMPVLVMNGDNDLLIPTSRSLELQKRIPDARLAIYSRAGHGFIWQYAELVGQHVNEFLDEPEPKASRL